jgi:hypothetical protein
MKITSNISNKKNQNKGNYYHGNMELPEVINMDSLAYANDDELERLHTFLQGERDKASKTDYDLQPWEVEICYVQREMRIRNSRRAAHDRYVRSNPDYHYYENVNTQEEDFDSTPTN